MGASEQAMARESQEWARTYLPPWVETTGQPEDINVLREAGHYLSPRLAEDPAAHLSTRQEVYEFVAQWPHKRFDEAQVALDLMEERGSRLPKDDLRTVFAVPVEADEHPAVLARTLDRYTHMDVAPGSLAVCLLVNQSSDDPNKAAIAVRRTRMTAQDMVEDEFPLFVAPRVYEGVAPMGRVYADTVDPILLYIALSDLNERILLVTNNADNTGLSRKYARWLEQAQTAMPDKDFFQPRLEWEKPKGADEMNKLIAYFEAMDKLLRQRTPYGSVTEANMGVDAAAYAAVGGFLRDKPDEQMAQLRRTYANARNGGETDPATARHILAERTQYLNSIFLRTSSRRLQEGFAQGIGPSRLWTPEGIPFATRGDALDRSRSPNDFPKEVEPSEADQVLKEIDAFYGQYISRSIGVATFGALRDQVRRKLALPAFENADR
jgi:hypothetical protein